jgi:dihydrolipoamide dehydrogenase
MSEFDVLIIGAGPGGYVCAIRAAQLGLKVACVERREALGGTCLNVGCIPSKALLHASEAYHEITNTVSKMGIFSKSVTVDWPKMQEYKETMITQNTQGINYLFKKNKISYIQGWAKLETANTVIVDNTRINAKHIVIATGSEPNSLPGIEIDGQRIVDSTSALSLPSIPKRLTVIGAGVIGLELGSVFSRLGTTVTVIEYLDDILVGMDKEISKAFLKILKKQGLHFIMKSAVKSVVNKKKSVLVEYKEREGIDLKSLESDIVLIATGRKAFTSNLGLENVQIERNKMGQISVNEYLQTKHSNIFAIGDAIEGPMLAHKAEDEGIAVAEQIAGQTCHLNYNLIPSVVYTSPEVASVGKTEQQLDKQNVAFKVGKFPFLGNGRAKVNFASEGFVKILADKITDRILGAHIVGPGAGDLIHEICVAMEFGASSEDLARTCHAHPTVSGAVREAALACLDGPIHS